MKGPALQTKRDTWCLWVSAFPSEVMVKLTTRLRGHFVTVTEVCMHLIETHLKHNLTWKSGSSIRSQHVAMTIELWAAESGAKVMWAKILRMLLVKPLLTKKLTSGASSCRNGVNIAAFTTARGSLFSVPRRNMTDVVHFFSMHSHFNESEFCGFSKHKTRKRF